MAKPSLTDVARKYCVEDLSGASIPGSRITKILMQLESKTPLSRLTLEYLSKNGFLALSRYAKSEISFKDFLQIAKPEQTGRREAAEAKTTVKETRRPFKREASLASLKREQEGPSAKERTYKNAPRIKAKSEHNKLRNKYDLSQYIEKKHFPKLMGILRRVDRGTRLTEDDIVWLTTNDFEQGYYTQKLRERYHENEAKFYANEFNKSKDPWLAVNASSHYRKCGWARIADSMLNTIAVSRFKNIKLKSALYTTHGGVKRDLGKHEQALSLGEQAHQLTPKDFRPCTLLGAVNMEIGNHILGESWYDKAVERGASKKSVDDDLRSIFMRAEPAKKEELRTYLLGKDINRYRWAKKK